jgi:linoleoyl-CoA desaturase
MTPGVSFINVLTGFLLMHFIASGLGLIALVSTHTGEESTWTFLTEDGRVNQTWAYHQLVSANDFSTDNPVANLTFGYFNHHVAHHLFPSVNPQLYKGVTRIIREYAKENNLPYRCYSIRQTLYSHYRLLRSNAFQLNLNAEL